MLATNTRRLVVVTILALLAAALVVASAAGGLAGYYLASLAAGKGGSAVELTAAGPGTPAEQAEASRAVKAVLTPRAFRVEVVIVHGEGHVPSWRAARKRLAQDIDWVVQQGAGLVATPRITLASVIDSNSDVCDTQRETLDSYLSALPRDDGRLTVALLTARGCTWAGVATADPPMVALAVSAGRVPWLPGVAAHEFAHALGADHAGSFACAGEDWDTSDPSCLAIEEYGDTFDPMGRGVQPRYPFTSITREQMGWPVDVRSPQNGVAPLACSTSARGGIATDADIVTQTGTYRVSMVLVPGALADEGGGVPVYYLHFLPRGKARWGQVPAEDGYQGWLPGTTVHDPAGGVSLTFGPAMSRAGTCSGEVSVHP